MARNKIIANGFLIFILRRERIQRSKETANQAAKKNTEMQYRKLES